jgi:hypothetical protein
MWKPGPALALVDAQALEPAEEIRGQAARGAGGEILQHDHSDAPGLAVALGHELDRISGRGGRAQSLADLGELSSRPVAQEGKSDVQVLARDGATAPQLARLPIREGVECGVGEPQRTEEP